MCGLPSFRRREASETKVLLHNVFAAKEEDAEFHTLFGRLKDNRQKWFKYFKMGTSKFENFKKNCCPQTVKKRNTHEYGGKKRGKITV